LLFLEYSNQVDVVVLASGDGDFDLLVQKIRQDKARVVEVYGVCERAAGSLIKAASQFIPIEKSC
jgi:uncharacterized LabA/DUF88 family protein